MNAHGSELVSNTATPSFMGNEDQIISVLWRISFFTLPSWPETEIKNVMFSEELFAHPVEHPRRVKQPSSWLERTVDILTSHPEEARNL